MIANVPVWLNSEWASGDVRITTGFVERLTGVRATDVSDALLPFGDGHGGWSAIFDCFSTPGGALQHGASGTPLSQQS